MAIRKTSIPGVDALFGPAPVVEQGGETPAIVPARMPAFGHAAEASPAEPGREKFTFRFDAATLALLERVWAELRGRTGKKIRKSWIVEAALLHVIRDPERALQVLTEEMKQVATA